MARIKKLDKLYFGTAGIPISTDRTLSSNNTTISGIKRVNELGLNNMEVEFVRGVYMNEEKAKEVGKIAKKENIILTAHAPYYINLNSNEKPKIHASVNRILQTASIAQKFGGFSIVFHPGYYMGMNQEKTYENMKKALTLVVEGMKENGINDIWIRPETTGKSSQFGDVDQIINLSNEFDEIAPCIDFAHLYARHQGKWNSYEDFSKILEMIEKERPEELKRLHIHMSGIDFNKGGEGKHLTLNGSKFNYKAVLKALKDFNVKGVVISESPIIEEDALLLKKEFEKLK